MQLRTPSRAPLAPHTEPSQDRGHRRVCPRPKSPDPRQGRAGASTAPTRLRPRATPTGRPHSSGAGNQRCSARARAGEPELFLQPTIRTAQPRILVRGITHNLCPRPHCRRLPAHPPPPLRMPHGGASHSQTSIPEGRGARGQIPVQLQIGESAKTKSNSHQRKAIRRYVTAGRQGDRRGGGYAQAAHLPRGAFLWQRMYQCRPPLACVLSHRPWGQAGVQARALPTSLVPAVCGRRRPRGASSGPPLDGALGM